IRWTQNRSNRRAIERRHASNYRKHNWTKMTPPVGTQEPVEILEQETTTTEKRPIIELVGVTKTYGKGQAAVQALRGVNLQIAESEFVAIMGPSGSGKSTIMNILGCLDVPTTGAFLFKGEHVENLTREQRALLRRYFLGFVFQGFNLLARTSAL